jgi:hypothetical protein
MTSLSANFEHIVGKLSDNNVELLSVVAAQTGANLGNIKYAIEFKVPGHEESFYVPCNDNKMRDLLTSKKDAINKLKLDCVVYRFYHMNTLTNFFYVDKVHIED